jgi:hypothetical protein
MVKALITNDEFQCWEANRQLFDKKKTLAKSPTLKRKKTKV